MCDVITYSVLVCFVRFGVLGVVKTFYFSVVWLWWLLLALCLLFSWRVCGV